MKFTRIKLENIGPHINTDIELAHLTVIRGPNACGKTHIGDAIELSLGGSTDGTDARGAGFADYIRLGQKKGVIKIAATSGDGDPRTFTTVLHSTKRDLVITKDGDDNYSGGTATKEWLTNQRAILKCLLNNRYFVNLPEDKQKDVLASIILPKSYLWADWVRPSCTRLGLKIDWDLAPYDLLKVGYKAAYEERTNINRRIKEFRLPEGDTSEAGNLDNYQKRLDQRRGELDAAKKCKSDALANCRVAQTKLQNAEGTLSASQGRISRENQALVSAEDGLLSADVLKKHRETVKVAKKAAKLDAKITELRAKVAADKEALKRIEALADTCPTCSQVLDEKVMASIAGPLNKAYNESADALKEAETERKTLGDHEGAQKAIDAHEKAERDVESIKGRIRDEQTIVRDIESTLDQIRSEAKEPDTTEVDADIERLNGSIAKGQEAVSKAHAAAQLQKSIDVAIESKKKMQTDSADIEKIVEYFETTAKVDMLSTTMQPFIDQVNHILSSWGYRAVLNLEPYAFSIAYTDGTKEYEVPVRRLSKSERYRFATAFQVALAIISEMRFVVVDEADIFDPSGRSSLFNALMDAPLDQVIILGTDMREEIPPVKDAVFYRFDRVGEPGEIPTTKVRRLH